MEATNFPFDTQNCSIRIGSWQHDTTRIILNATILNPQNNTNNIDDTEENSEFTPNPIWDIVYSDTISKYTDSRMNLDNNSMNLIDNEYDEHSNEDMVFSIKIKRRPLYYMINNIYPSLILNIISLLAFALPFASQVTLCNYI